MNRDKLQRILNEYYAVSISKRDNDTIEILEALLEEDSDKSNCHCCCCNSQN